MQVYAGVSQGDVLCIRTTGLAAQMIRLGEEIHDQPSLDNHIAVFHHIDVAGIPWIIEARPGGVGWRDARDYLNSHYTITNQNQPGRKQDQREQICTVLQGMLATPYDWPAILQDASDDLHLPRVWREKWGDNQTSPAHVVCSSLAAWAYGKVGWERPQTADPAHVQPSEWLKFILDNHYNEQEESS